MRSVFVIVLGVLLALTAVAWRIAPQPVQEGKTRLVWVSDDNPMRRAQVAPFNAMFPQYRLELDPSNASLEKIIVQSLAGVGPDLFDCYSPFQLAAHVRSGVAWDVTDELAKMGLDIRKDTWAAVHPDCIYEGRVYGFPTNAAVNGLWYHRRMVQEQGVSVPQTPWAWEQFIPVAQKLMQRDARGRVTRYGLVFEWDSNYLQFMYQWGGALFDATGTRCTIDSPQCVAAVEFMLDLSRKHGICPDLVSEQTMATTGGWGAGPITLFAGGKSATALGGRWWLCILRDQGLDLGAAWAPHGPRNVLRGYGKATLINRNSPRRQQALDFFRYQMSATYNQVINDQADGIGPMIKYAQGERFLHNPRYPQEDFNQVWVDMMHVALPDIPSPFVNGEVSNRVINKQMDLIRRYAKTPAAGLADAAAEINRQIQQTIQDNPELERVYQQRRKEAP